MKKNIKILSIAVACLALLSCGKSAPDFDEAAILSQIGFNNEITVSANFSNLLDYRGNVQANDDTRMLSWLYTIERAALKPNPDKAPYWTISAPSGISDGKIVVPVAKRSIVNRSDPEQWDEGSVDYFAQTITYQLELQDKVKAKVPSIAEKQYTFRLVIKKDPAVGTWTVAERGNTFDETDTQELREAINTQGSVDFLQERIAATKSEAFDILEKRLAADGTIERGTFPETAVSKKNKLIWFTGAVVLDGHHRSELEGICSALAAPEGVKWRPPSAGELLTLMKPVNRNFGMGDWNRALFDTPDQRLFGELSAGTPQRSYEHVRLVTNTIWTYEGKEVTEVIPRPGTLFQIVNFNGHPDNTFVRDTDLDGTPLDRRYGFGSRVLCVAPLGG